MTDFTNDEAKASYGIGLQMGQQLKGAFDDVSLQAAIDGISDAFEEKQQQVEHAEINAAFAIIQKQIAEKSAKDSELYAEEGENFLIENKKRTEIQITDSGLQYEILKKGDGECPTKNDTVRTHYRGTLINGEEFDSSYSRGEPTEFPVSGVIAGWTEALQLMPIGSKWKLYIPYQLAYGEQGAGGSIGPYQALIFELELLKIIS
jgi:FKBP-type peptidyl-prolyl cis-trans isomerase FklB